MHSRAAVRAAIAREMYSQMKPFGTAHQAIGLIPCILFCVALVTAPAGAVSEGDHAPDFSAPMLDGDGMLELSNYRGKVVYLDFWASWCAPCLKAIPEIEKIRNEMPASEFQIVAVNLDQKQKKALRFLKKHPIGYPSARDPEGRIPVQFGLETMPTSYLIDTEGVIRYVHPGFKKGDGDKLRREIRALLEKASSETK